MTHNSLMPPGAFAPDLFGVRVVTCSLLCAPPRFLRWRRTHRQKRIRLKWQKKYGAVMSQCVGVGSKVLNQGGRTVYMCPHALAAMKEGLAK